MKQYVAAVVCLACAVLTLLWPWAMIFAAIALIGYEFYVHRDQIAQVVAGNKKVLDVLPPAQQETVKLAMASEQTTVKPVVESLIGSVKT